MHYSVSFTTTKTIRILWIFLLCLLIANLIANYLRWVKGYGTALGIVPLFDFDVEFNIPSLFSVGLIAINALLLFLIARHTAVAVKERKYWRIFSYVFVYLALDELASIHERIGECLFKLAPDLLPTDISRFWILPMGVLLLFFLFYFFRFYWSLPARTKIGFVVAGLIFVFGAIGVELLGELYMWYHAKPDFTYGLLASLEELCEMIGMILFMRVLLLHLQELSNTECFNLQLSTSNNRSE